MTAAERYWEQFVETRPFSVRPDRPFADAFSFGLDESDAAGIAELVKAGTKTATGSVLWSYEFDGKPVPAVGDHCVVLGEAGRPACIIRITQVEILPFDRVPAIYAALGGEGDRSVAHWRRIYRRHVEEECARVGRAPSDSVPLVMERFEVVYAEPLDDGDAADGAGGGAARPE